MTHNKDWKFMTQAVKQLNVNPLFSVRKENIRCQSTRRNEKKRIRKSKNNFLSETNDLKNKFYHSQKHSLMDFKLVFGANISWRWFPQSTCILCTKIQNREVI